MAKFCTKCGNTVNETDIICSKCNNLLKSEIIDVEKNSSKTSLVLGIISICSCILAFIKATNPMQELASKTSEAKMGYAAGYVLWPIIFSIVGIYISITERKKLSSSSNIWGFWLGLVSIIFSVINFLLILKNN